MSTVDYILTGLVVALVVLTWAQSSTIKLLQKDANKAKAWARELCHELAKLRVQQSGGHPQPTWRDIP